MRRIVGSVMSMSFVGALSFGSASVLAQGPPPLGWEQRDEEVGTAGGYACAEMP